MDRLRLLLVKLGIDVYIELRGQIPVSESLVQQPARLIAKRSLLRPSYASVWNLETKKSKLLKSSWVYKNLWIRFLNSNFNLLKSPSLGLALHVTFLMTSRYTLGFNDIESTYLEKYITTNYYYIC